ncbi:MAG: VCBS domain-containing protein, partial [Pseudomonadota bacterium]
AYTYTLDNTNPAVQALAPGETLTEILGHLYAVPVLTGRKPGPPPDPLCRDTFSMVFRDLALTSPDSTLRRKIAAKGEFSQRYTHYGNNSAGEGIGKRPAQLPSEFRLQPSTIMGAINPQNIVNFP